MSPGGIQVHGSHRTLSATATTSASDADLIMAVRAHDADAYARLYRRHVGAARAAARTLVRSRSAAEDLVAEGFTRVLTALRRGAGPEVAFRPYLLACIRNAWHDRHRKEGRVVLSAEPLEDEPLLAPAVDDADAALIARAFATLPPRWQAVLWHTAVEDLPPAEVAEILGLTPGAVAALGYRAREGLRQAYLQAHIGTTTDVDCRAVRGHLAAYVRDALPEAARQRVDAHLESCAACSAVRAELIDVDSSLRSALVPLLVGGSAGTYLAGLGAGGVGAGLGAAFGGLLGGGALKIGMAAAMLAAVGTAAVARPAALDSDRALPAAVAFVGRPDDGATSTTGVDRLPGTADEDEPGSAPGAPADPGPPSATAPSDPAGAAPVDPAAPAPEATPPLDPGAPGANPGSPGNASPDPAAPGADPAVIVPGVSVPSVTVPGVATPPLAVPGVSVPSVTVPGVGLPPVTLPAVPVPPVTVPLVTVPTVTVPPVTVPAVTVPTVTLPPVTTPPVTVPPVTLPPVTTPPVTVPPVTLPPVTTPPPPITPPTLAFP